MRILVCSDCHGAKYNFLEAVKRESNAEVVVFLGDGFRDYEEIKAEFSHTKAFLAVSGNCDLACNFPDITVRSFEDKKFYITHGHNEKVKFGIDELKWSAMDRNCDVALFGHTHDPLSVYRDGIYIFNPGALRDGFYGVIDITNKGIICINKSLVY